MQVMKYRYGRRSWPIRRTWRGIVSATAIGRFGAHCRAAIAGALGRPSPRSGS